IDNVKMSIRSDNLSMLEFGRRATLGLVDNYPDYTDGTQPMVYVRGDGDRAALQFAASGTSFYKPMFYTVANGSFRLKGSAGGTDMFEIGSAGPANQGRLEFIVGDDGNEPMVFSRYEYRTGSKGNKEFFRVQGSKDAEDATTRFGVNLNPTFVPLDPAYNTGDSGAMANSTFQVNGSIANSTLTTTAALTLTENHYAITLGGSHQITLPAAAESKGRIYVIKNPTSNSVTISSYRNNLNVASTSISSGSSLWIQSDGTNWQQISSDGGATVYTGSFIIPSYNSLFSTAPAPAAQRTVNYTYDKIGFKPSQITFTVNANVENTAVYDKGSGTDDLNNVFGTATGFARSAGVDPPAQQFSFVGGNYGYLTTTDNFISRYAEADAAFGIRYSDRNGNDIGRFKVQVTGFIDAGLTFTITYYQGTMATTTRNQIFSESLLVMFTAYK
ncbi:MAG: hypothetical protein KKH44_04980, partial [Bacteroidetes bacterium]|nr:hypothetical protein [Bacteroidota bacterium]